MADFSKELEWIDDQEDRMIEMVREWSRINSGSYNFEGLTKMGSVITKAFSFLEAELEIRETKNGETVDKEGNVKSLEYGPVYHFKKRPEANRKILLTGHIDTVFPKDHAFQDVQILEDNILNGPGVADMKGGLIVMLVALEALEKSKVGKKLGYEILLSCDEEIGSIGSAPFLKDRAEDCDFGMTYEPALADGTLAGDRKGSGNFTLVVRGKSAHAGREFEKGVNAIQGLSGFILDLYELNGKKDDVTINPAIIEGGEANNIVPGVAILRFNVRIRTREQQKWFEKEYKKLLEKHNKRKNLKFEAHGHFNRPPKNLTPANKKLFKILKEYGKEIDIDVEWQPTGGCCEGNNLAAAGLPNIDTLGVRGGKIHTSEEFVCLDSFAERAKLSALLLLNYAAGNFEMPKK